MMTLLNIIHNSLNHIKLLDITPLISRPPKEQMFLVLNLTPYCYASLSYITCFNIQMKHQRIQTTRTRHIVIIEIVFIMTMLILC